MAIRMGDLYNRQHDKLRRCVEFDFDIRPEDTNRPRITVHFERVSADSAILWRVSWHDLGKAGSDGMRAIAYSLIYAMPMDNMNLTMVCAYGLRCLAAAFADTIQDMSAHEYFCYDVTKDM